MPDGCLFDPVEMGRTVEVSSDDQRGLVRCGDVGLKIGENIGDFLGTRGPLALDKRFGRSVLFSAV